MKKDLINLLKMFFTKKPEKYIKKLGVKFGKGTKFVIGPHFWNYPDFSTEPYLIEFGENTEVSSGCTFLTHDGSTWCFRRDEKYKNIIRYGKIIVGDNCFIGCNCTILPNVKIGNNCIVAAGSIVTKDIPDNEVWGGNPAKYICDTYDLGEKFLRQTPNYDLLNYKTDKKNEVEKIAEKMYDIKRR